MKDDEIGYFGKEILWERIADESGKVRYAITSDRRRDIYYLYRFKKAGSTPERIARARTPVELHKKFRIF